MSGEYRELPDLSALQPSTFNPDTFDAETGEFARYFIDPDTGSYLDIEGVFGYQRPTGASAGEYVYEQHVLSLDYVQATEGRGLGTAGLKLMITEGLRAGMHQGRMSIINPRAVDMIERLHEDDSIIQAYYRIDSTITRHAVVATDTFHELPDLCCASEAKAYLAWREQMMPMAFYGPVDCTIWF